MRGLCALPNNSWYYGKQCGLVSQIEALLHPVWPYLSDIL
ncbi:hypothetical protein HMPREF0454_00549 [Hafnia alvei ATCC 51873]|uniref:Uncharacterized protein n=1 Tax=Hafnia alvei ATCC 51873 TaxID=1002364 RepID=G9Y2R1_HAFAL|nr:hypothetical protein HMPREF0454_00549 [Hafnia alvei ATCC 51873]